LATRYNALQALLAVKQESSETIPAFISCAREALRYWQSTCPAVLSPAPTPAATASFLLEDVDKELLISVLLNGTKYSALTTSLLAQSELTVQQVEDVLKNEEAHRVGVAAAAAAPSVASSLSSGFAAPAMSSVCTFCGKSGHTVEHCFKFEDYSKKAREEVSRESSNNLKKQHNTKWHKGKASAAQEKDTPTENAGVASVRLSTSPSSLPDAWNADTGATSHMTPRREWFKSYGPSRVAIRVANGQVVYSAGVGTVEFTPVKDGRKMCPVIFSNVLHVPSLNQNLLSVLTLTCNFRFEILIVYRTMAFILKGIP
jgi:hypothetical protein